MIHARSDYDRIQDPSGKIPYDEPVFLLRAQDPAAYPTMIMWAIITDLMGGGDEIVSMATAQAKRMKDWPVKKKVADLPTEVPDTWTLDDKTSMGGDK